MIGTERKNPQVSLPREGLNAEPWHTGYGWSYFLLPLDTPSKLFGKLGAVVDCWRERHQDGKPPKLRDFTPRDFSTQWRLASVMDVVSTDPPTYKVRYWGTELNRLHGGEWTGKILTPAESRESVHHLFVSLSDLAFYRENATGEYIGYAHGPVEAIRDFRSYVEEITLPLSGDNGEIDKLLFVMFEHESMRVVL